MRKQSQMNTTMSSKRARRILDAYGGEPDKWPHEERAALLQLLENAPALRETRQRNLELDALLDTQSDLDLAPEELDKLSAKILRQLPTQPASGMAQGPASQPRLQLPHLRFWWPLDPIAVVGLVATLVVFLPVKVKPVPSTAELAFEKWAWEDVTAQALVPETGSENDEIEMIDLLGLSQNRS